MPKAFSLIRFLIALLLVVSSVTAELDPDLVEKAISLSNEAATEENIRLAREGDISALYRIARDVEKDHLQVALGIFHHLADGEKGHIASQISLGFIYYKQIVDHAKALHYFISAGEKGPNQASLYNAGRIFSEHSNWVPAIAYIQAAVQLGETSKNEENQKLTKTCTEAFETVSEKVATEGLTIQESGDIFMYASLEGFPAKEPLSEKRWSEGMHALLDFETSYVEGNGQTFDKEALEKAISKLRKIWEIDSTKMSKLQAHLLLQHINDALAVRSGLDDVFVPAAAGYAEAFAMSDYCFKRASTSEEEPNCFNRAVTSAASYYRRADDKEGLQRVMELARKNTGSSTAWKLDEQTPEIFHPDLAAKPWWHYGDFETTKSLPAIYEAHKKSLSAELETLKIRSDGWSYSGQLDRRPDEAEVGTDGTTVAEEARPRGILHRTSIPYTLIRSAEGTLGGWAEYPFFDGIHWDSARCKVAPSVCQALRSPATSLCAGVKPGLSPEDVDRLCGTDMVVSLVRLTPGTRILSHAGTTNRCISLNWCVEGCRGVQHTVGGVTVKDFGGHGNPILFDDSFEHEILHNGSKDAYFVLAILAHPDAK